MELGRVYEAEDMLTSLRDEKAGKELSEVSESLLGKIPKLIEEYSSSCNHSEVLPEECSRRLLYIGPIEVTNAEERG